MHSSSKFTLMELLVVLLIMVLAGALVIGSLSRLPAFAALGESAGRVAGMYAFCSEAAMNCNRPVNLSYNPESGTIILETPLELDEPEYGKPTIDDSFQLKDEESFSSDSLPRLKHGISVQLPAGCKMEFEADKPSAEEVSGNIFFSAVEDEKKEDGDSVVVARFFPDGTAESKRWRMVMGQHHKYGELSGVGVNLKLNDSPLTPWREEKK